MSALFVFDFVIFFSFLLFGVVSCSSLFVACCLLCVLCYVFVVLCSLFVVTCSLSWFPLFFVLCGLL